MMEGREGRCVWAGVEGQPPCLPSSCPGRAKVSSADHQTACTGVQAENEFISKGVVGSCWRGGRVWQACMHEMAGPVPDPLTPLPPK